MNLLELLGESPAVFDYEEWQWTRMTLLEVYEGGFTPGDSFEGKIIIPPGWYLHLVRLHSWYPVEVITTATGGEFSFSVVDGLGLELIVSDEKEPWSGTTYGPLHAELHWGDSTPTGFWQDFVGCKEVF